MQPRIVLAALAIVACGKIDEPGADAASASGSTSTDGSSTGAGATTDVASTGADVPPVEPEYVAVHRVADAGFPVLSVWRRKPNSCSVITMSAGESPSGVAIEVSDTRFAVLRVGYVPDPAACNGPFLMDLTDFDAFDPIHAESAEGTITWVPAAGGTCPDPPVLDVDVLAVFPPLPEALSFAAQGLPVAGCPI